MILFINNLFYSSIKYIRTSLSLCLQEISKFPPEELIEFRAWFEKFDAEVLDRQLESDIKSGKLDNPAKEAIRDFKDGKYKKI